MDKRVELLAPAGNPEKLEIAVHYGADAVYLAGKHFSLRNFSGNFTDDELARAISYCREHGVKSYVTVNVYPRTDEEGELRAHLRWLAELGPDGIIIADPGVFVLAQELAPEVELHVSTQANVTSAGAARFWGSLGASRVNIARELSLDEICRIVREGELEVEAFVHGSMCVSYSGRCLISSFLTGRDANRGQCTHPCRWKYVVEEETRPGQYMPVAEDERGSYIFNSKDLCMIDHVPALIEAGISSFKIEGRMKGLAYLATTVKCYREAIDRYYEDPKGYAPDPAWSEALTHVNSWEYSTGFYFGYEPTTPNYENTRPGEVHRLVGKVLSVRDEVATVGVRNMFRVGDRLRLLKRKGGFREKVVTAIVGPEGLESSAAKNDTTVRLGGYGDCEPNDLLVIAEPHRYGGAD